MDRVESYKKVSKAFKKALKTLQEHETKETLYIAQRIDRLTRMMDDMLVTNEKNWDIVVMISRPTVDIALNIINLLALGQEYADFLDRESEDQNLLSSRDYLCGYISYQDKQSRRRFLRDFQSSVMDKFEHSHIQLRVIRSDSSKAIHDNQCSYRCKPTTANIEYIDNIIFFLSVQIYTALCSRYEVKPKKHMTKLKSKGKKIMKEYKIIKDKDMKKLGKILAL